MDSNTLCQACLHTHARARTVSTYLHRPLFVFIFALVSLPFASCQLIVDEHFSVYFILRYSLSAHRTLAVFPFARLCLTTTFEINVVIPFMRINGEEEEQKRKKINTSIHSERLIYVATSAAVSIARNRVSFKATQSFIVFGVFFFFFLFTLLLPPAYSFSSLAHFSTFLLIILIIISVNKTIAAAVVATRWR